MTVGRQSNARNRMQPLKQIAFPRRQCQHCSEIEIGDASLTKGVRMHFHFSSLSVPRHDRISLVRDETSRRLYSITLGEWRDPDSFRLEFDVRIAGGFRIVTMDTVLSRASRTKADVARDTEEDFILYRVLDGPQTYRFETDEFELAAGDVCIGSTARCFEGAARSGFRFDLVMIPRAALAPLLAGGGLDHTVRLPASSALGNLLSASLSAAITNFDALPVATSEGVLRNLSGLVALAYNASEEGREVGRGALRAARVSAVRRHIQHHLADPDLSPASAADASRMSLRTLHALFAATGESFSQYVMRQRLAACHAVLTGPEASCWTTSALAYAWGFNSLATFYRAFLAAYGASPSDVRGAAGTPD
jgi:AraC-like DNA-binding protein